CQRERVDRPGRVGGVSADDAGLDTGRKPGRPVTLHVKTKEQAKYERPAEIHHQDAHGKPGVGLLLDLAERLLARHRADESPDQHGEQNCHARSLSATVGWPPRLDRMNLRPACTMAVPATAQTGAAARLVAAYTSATSGCPGHGS